MGTNANKYIADRVDETDKMNVKVCIVGNQYEMSANEVHPRFGVALKLFSMELILVPCKAHPFQSRNCY